MMKLTKREKRMFIVLASLIGLYSYINFIVNPQVATMRELKSEIEGYELTLSKSNNSEDILSKLNHEYDKQLKSVEDYTKGYFTSLEQSTLIILLDKFITDTDLEISGIEFSAYRTEQVGDTDLNAISATIPFSGYYESLLDFLKQVRQNDKRILVKDINISNGDEGQVSGNVVLDFYSIPPLGSRKLSDGIIKEASPSKFNPFSPFEGYISGLLESLDPNNADNGGIPPNYYENPIVSNPAPSVPEAPREEFKKALLEGFETLDMFFVGNPRDVLGNVSMYTNKSQGNYSVKLDYDFIVQRSTNLANAVFDKKKPKLSMQPEFISISVYSYEKSSHRIGLILRDSVGKEYNILLADSVDWLYWNTLEATLPNEITYPAEIQRMYVQGNDLQGKTNGVFLFDNLEVAYRDTLPHSYQNNNAVNSSQYVEYYVKEGDTMFNITKRFYNDYSKRFIIMELNNIKDPNQIEIGQKLLIPKI